MCSIKIQLSHIFVHSIFQLSVLSQNLPESHLLKPPSCWGYEQNCSPPNKVSHQHCEEGANSKGWPGDDGPEELFDKQADFGFVKERLGEMMSLCEPLDEHQNTGDSSSLKCSKDLQFCIAKNIRLDFTALTERVENENLKYRMDIFQPGDITLSSCDLKSDKLMGQLELMSPLQSWAPELRNLGVSKGSTRKDCDLVIDTPTYIVKLDASVNMYHHFCDFFNLYLSIHMNYSMSGMDISSWSVNKQVLILENIPYKSAFKPAWSAFTSHPLMDIKSVAGKKVCFKEAMFPLLPRLLFGLFYNTPVVAGCSNSGLFHSFSEFILHRLQIPAFGLLPHHRMRVTIISRETRFRRVDNEGELVKVLEQTGLYKVTLARYSPHVPFPSQLTITHNTDILVGMHGAGLTHLLFLPAWAEVFELYNCDDPGCYSDLARLRGVGYTTHDWGKNGNMMKVVEVNGGNTGPAHKKFVNYEFDIEEFVRVMNSIRKKVLNKKIYRAQHDEL